jgi:hypothetical protein
MGRPATPLETLVRTAGFRARRHAPLLSGPELPWPTFAALQRTYRGCGNEQERRAVALDFERAVKVVQEQARDLLSEGSGDRELARPTSGRSDGGIASSPTQAAKRVFPRLALSPTEAAESLGVSRDFFDEHIAPELRIVRRGRRKLIDVRVLQGWLSDASALTLEGM